MKDGLRGVRMESVPLDVYTLQKPLRINGQHARGDFYLPFTDEEIPLIPSVNRGRKVANMCGGVDVAVLKDEMTRAPLLSTPDEIGAGQLAEYIQRRYSELKSVGDATTRYGSVTSIEPAIRGEDVHVRVGMSTGDAAGHNMAEKAAAAIVEYILADYGKGARMVSLSGNYCTDKKAAQTTIDKGRGKTVEARLLVPAKTLETHLDTDAERLVELNRKKNIEGSRLAGCMGANAHHVNMVKGIFLLTGQDLGNLVEASLGETKVSVVGADCHFKVRMPALIVGTVGGSTSRPHARKYLAELGCLGSGTPVGVNAKKLAEIIAATTLCGELSLMAELTNGYDLLETHMKYERG